MEDQELDEKVSYFCEHYLEKIKAIYRPTGLWLWGSRAQGTAHEYSDIDLIIVSEEFEGIKFVHRRLDFKQRLGLLWDREAEIVDAVCYTPQEFERKQRQISIVNQAVETGIRLI